MAEVRIPSSECLQVESKHVDQVFEISVGLPPGYRSGSERRYPVVYLLDPNISFGTATECVRLMTLGRELPRVIVVGIGYPGAATPEALVLRSRDYTPTTGPKQLEQLRKGLPADMPELEAGGAAAFLSFIREELFPFIDARYATDPDNRGFIGDSLGGLFGLYTLFHRPDSFGRYVIGSPSLWWDDGVTFSYEEAFAANHSELPARVFLSVGGLEEPGADGAAAWAHMVSNVEKISKILEGRSYVGLELTTHVFEGETHVSVLPATVSRGLRTVFAS